MFRIYYVYILECSDGTFYTGVTNDLERRMLEHESGTSRNSYTSTRLPVILVWREMFQDPEQAIAWEKRIKKWSRKKKIALINDDFDSLPNLSMNSWRRSTFGVTSSPTESSVDEEGGKVEK